MTDRHRLRAAFPAALAAALFPVCAAAATATANSAGITLVEIAPGSFSMGSTSGDWDERPVRTVTIGAPFLIGATEVTNAQYERFDPAHRELRGKLGFSAGDDEAAVFVSWHDAAAFCAWLSEKEGAPYRLPTEAEWEYACRAGTTTAYSAGDALPAAFRKNATMCWYPDPRAAVSVDLTAGATPANAWGLYDMHGNVEEWCLDWYGPYEAEDATDPVGRAGGDFRVTRGGSHSTTVEYLRSANRSGTLPEDRSWLIGFRVVRAPPPRTQPLPPPAPPLNRRNVRQEIPPDLARGPDPARPYFKGPRRFAAVPPGSEGPLFSKHNHDPAIVDCPNGDLLAIWYTCRSEPGRELGIAASRLRHGAEEWDPPSPFWDAPDRNDHAPALWVDAKGTIYHFNGLSAAATWGNLATVMRTSTDSGATWSKARLIMPEHGLRHMPVESVIATRDGALIVPCDAVTGGNGGTAIVVSRDAGATWTDPGEGRPAPRFAAGATGAWIAGIHAGLVELGDGRLLALGRGDSIAGRMPMSISADRGTTWTYAASPFPPIGGGQRLALLRLREGPILACSFGTDVTMRDASGQERRGSGLFAALSTDEGRSWTIKRLVTPGGPPREIDGGGNTGRFTMRGDAAEPRGYLSICQTPDRTIHLLSSAQHYAFNLAWLDEVAVAGAPAALDDCNVVCQTPSPDAAGAMPVGNGEVGASVWIEPNGDVLLYLARSAYLTRRYAVDNGWSYDGNAAALLGLAGEAARILLERCRNSHPAFRFSAAWGPNFDWLPDQTHGGNLMHMAQLMLVQPADRKILLLPAWPAAWDVSFRLHAPGRTVVEAEVRSGRLTRLAVTPASRRADVEICAPFAAE